MYKFDDDITSRPVTGMMAGMGLGYLKIANICQLRELIIDMIFIQNYGNNS